jgi:tRNA G26 N,N-dimethylase Trm1
MSGGSFDYCYSAVNEFVGVLEIKLRNNNKKSDGFSYDFGPEIVNELEKVRDECTKVGALMKAVEWLYSGDFGPETFLKEIAKIYSNSKKSRHTHRSRVDNSCLII